MKKILFLLLCTVVSYGQTYQNPTFGTIKTKTSPTVTTTPHLGTVETDGTISKITPENLPISNATINYFYVNDTDFEVIKSSIKTHQDYFLQVDKAVLKARGTCVYRGGLPTVVGGIGIGTTVSISSGDGEILNMTTPTSPDYIPVSWSAVTGATPITSSGLVYFYVDTNGVIQQTTSAPTDSERKLRLYLFRISVTAGVITGVAPELTLCAYTSSTVRELSKAIGTIKLQGVQPTYSGANLKLQVTSGQFYSYADNYSNSYVDPNTVTLSTFNTGVSGNFRYGIPSGVIAVNQTDVQVQNYAPAGVVTTIPGATTRVGLHFVWVFPAVPNYRLTYGNSYYNNFTDALTALPSIDPYSTAPTAFTGATLLGVIIAQSGATDLSNTSQAIFRSTNKLGFFSGGSFQAGGSYLQIANNLSDVADVTTARSNLGAEAVANKTGTLTASSTLYPNNDAVIAYVDSKTPTTYAKVVYVNSVNPNTATIFDLNNPPTVNDNLLKTDVNNLYIGTDASTWVYNGTTYVTKTIPATSNFYLYGTTIDAGNTKTRPIERTGIIASSGFIKSGATTTDALLAGGTTLANPLSGTGTANTIPKFSGTSTQQNSSISDDGTTVSTSLNLKIGNTKILGVNGGESFTIGKITGAGNATLTMSAITSFTGSFTLNNGSGITFGNTSNMFNASTSTPFLFDKTGVGSAVYSFSSNVSDVNFNNTGLVKLTNKLLVGTTTDNGNIGRFAGTIDVNKLQLNNTPATASGTPPLLTWNSTTKDVESVPYATFAPTASPAFTGTPTAPTAAAGTNTTQIATTAFVTTANSGNLQTTGSQSFTGVKTSTNSGSLQTNGLSLINNGTGGTSYSQYISNNSSGIGLRIQNNSTGSALRINNTTGATGRPFEVTYNDLAKAYLDGTNGDFTAQKLISNDVVRLKSYTVATLPAGTQGDTAYVTDATAPTYLGTLTGGGSVVCPVFYNGTAWVSH